MMSYEPRALNTQNLDRLALHMAREFKETTRRSLTTERLVAGRGYVLQDLYNLTFKDVHEYVLPRVRDQVGMEHQAEFDRLWASHAEPRRDDVFENLLAKKLAIRPDGSHIKGRLGTTEIGNRVVGTTVREFPRYLREKTVPRSPWDRILFRNGSMVERATFSARHVTRRRTLAEIRYVTKRLYWPVYAGELEEREIGSDIVDPLPEGSWPFDLVGTEVMANNPRAAAAAVIAGLDAMVDLLDAGGDATIRGRTGSQPADPDATETGTLLFTLTMSTTAFGNASDTGGQATASAASITDDTSADASGTLTYCRMGATAPSADDLFDGEAGTSGADFNFNTVSIASGATVSMTSLDMTLSQT